MLIFGGRLVHAAVAETRPERRPVYEKVLGKIYQSIGGYIGGLTFICLVNATLTITFLAIARVPFFLPLGLVAGLSSLVPYAGPLVAGTGISLIALVTKGTGPGVASAIYFVLYGQLEGNILGPLVFRRTVHVNPLVTTLSIVFFGEIAGIVGAIVAVPVIATLQIVARELLRIRREQLGLPIRPTGPHQLIKPRCVTVLSLGSARRSSCAGPVAAAFLPARRPFSLGLVLRPSLLDRTGEASAMD